jgi:hypothetical protein
MLTDSKNKPIEYSKESCSEENLTARLRVNGDEGWSLVSATPVINSLGGMNIMAWHLIFARYQSEEKVESGE